MSYNHPNITSECLRSVLPRVEASRITLVHNGSLEAHSHKLKNEFPEITHILLEQNKGYSGGCNFALESMSKKYEWIYFLTNDVLLLELGELPQEVGFYAPQIWRRKLGVVDSLGGGFIPQEQKLYHLKDPQEFHTLPEGHLTYIPGTAFLIHRQIFSVVGGMDETLHTYWEDVDFSQRVKANLFKLDLVPSFQLIHKVGKTCHKDKFYTNHLFHRNKEIISNKYLNLI